MWVELKIDFADDFLRDLTMPSFDAQSEHPMSFEMPELSSRG